MKKCFLYIATMFAGAMALHAETPITIHAPFEFIAAGKMLPAGDYEMNVIAPGVLRIAGKRAGVLALVNLSPEATTPAAAFEDTGSGPVLKTVSGVNGTWTLVGVPVSRLAVSLRAK